MVGEAPLRVGRDCERGVGDGPGGGRKPDRTGPALIGSLGFLLRTREGLEQQYDVYCMFLKAHSG